MALDFNTPLTGFPGIEDAAQGYGFTPQLDARTKMYLRGFYTQLLEAGDPLEVHQAKEARKLLEYAQSLLGLTNDRVPIVLCYRKWIQQGGVTNEGLALISVF